MRRIYILLSVWFAFCTILPVAAAAQEGKFRMAVFDPTSAGTSIDEGTKITIREIISSTIVNTGKHTIVERSLLEKVMQEQAFSQSGAVDDTQMAEIGKLTGADKIVVSVVTLTGGRNMLSVKMIDVKTANIDRQQVKVVTSGELLDIIEPMTLTLIGEKTNWPADQAKVPSKERNSETAYEESKETPDAKKRGFLGVSFGGNKEARDAAAAAKAKAKAEKKKAESDRIQEQAEGYIAKLERMAQQAAPINLNNYYGNLLSRGNNVYLPVERLAVYELAGVNELARQILSERLWNIVDNPRAAHIILEFHTSTKGSDHSWVEIISGDYRTVLKDFSNSKKGCSESEEDNEKVAEYFFRKGILPLIEKLEKGKKDKDIAAFRR